MRQMSVHALGDTWPTLSVQASAPWQTPFPGRTQPTVAWRQLSADSAIVKQVPTADAIGVLGQMLLQFIPPFQSNRWLSPMGGIILAVSHCFRRTHVATQQASL